MPKALQVNRTNPALTALRIYQTKLILIALREEQQKVSTEKPIPELGEVKPESTTVFRPKNPGTQLGKMEGEASTNNLVKETVGTDPEETEVLSQIVHEITEIALDGQERLEVQKAASNAQKAPRENGQEKPPQRSRGNNPRRNNFSQPGSCPTCNQNLGQRNNALHPGAQRIRSQGYQPLRTFDGRIICYRCRRVGHTARECRNPPGNDQNQEQNPNQGRPALLPTPTQNPGPENEEKWSSQLQ